MGLSGFHHVSISAHVFLFYHCSYAADPAAYCLHNYNLDYALTQTAQYPFRVHEDAFTLDCWSFWQCSIQKYHYGLNLHHYKSYIHRFHVASLSLLIKSCYQRVKSNLLLLAALCRLLHTAICLLRRRVLKTQTILLRQFTDYLLVVLAVCCDLHVGHFSRNIFAGDKADS